MINKSSMLSCYGHKKLLKVITSDFILVTMGHSSNHCFEVSQLIPIDAVPSFSLNKSANILPIYVQKWSSVDRDLSNVHCPKFTSGDRYSNKCIISRLWSQIILGYICIDINGIRPCEIIMTSFSNTSCGEQNSMQALVLSNSSEATPPIRARAAVSISYAYWYQKYPCQVSMGNWYPLMK